MEVMRWSGMEGIYGPTLRATDVFGNGNEKRWEDLHTRCIEHVSHLASYMVSLMFSARIFEL